MDNEKNPIADALNIEYGDAPFYDNKELGEDGYCSVATFIASCGDLDLLTASQLAHLYAHVKEQFDQLDAARDEMSKFIELIKNVKIPARFDKEEIKTFTLEDGTRVTKSERTTCSILDQVAAYSWLRNNGYKDIIKETVNAQTLGGVAKEVLSNLETDKKTGMVKAKNPECPIDMPSDIFKVTISPTTSITKGKKK